MMCGIYLDDDIVLNNIYSDPDYLVSLYGYIESLLIKLNVTS